MRILSPVLRDEGPGISFLPHESVSSSFWKLMKLREVRGGWKLKKLMEVREVKGQQPLRLRMGNCRRYSALAVPSEGAGHCRFLLSGTAILA